MKPRRRRRPQDYDDEPEYQPAPVHPLHRYAPQQPQAPAQDYYEQPQYADAEPQQDPSRYDDALYGRIESGEHDYQRDPAYPDDPYAYQNGYDEEPAPKKRSSGLMTVAAVLALAVVGTGAAFAYRTYVGSPRSGEPPIIRADNSPTKVVPAQSDGGASKTPDRMPSGDGGEKLVSREEAPVDVNSRSGAPRVVFPPLNQNSNPPTVASVSPTGAALATAANGTLPNNEPRRIKTLAVKGDAAENGGIPAGATAPPPRPGPATRSVAAPAAPAAAAPAVPPAAPGARNPASANASANTPISLAPQAGQPSDSAPTRVAVERVIAQHPAVLEAAVIGIPDDKWGEIGHALVVLHPGGQLNEPELLDYLGPELAKYKIPKRFTIRQEPLPRTTSGKVQKFVVREQVGARA